MKLPGFEPTYKELKPANERIFTRGSLSFEPTYKELKLLSGNRKPI